MIYGFNAAIGLRVDPQDNVWTIDEAANQVVKFDPDGHVALVLGRKPESISVRRPARQVPKADAARRWAARAPVAERAARTWTGGPPGAGTPGSSFNHPTDVAWDKAGNIYIADGIGSNNRVAKFDKDGKFLAHWGRTGSETGTVQGRQEPRD